MMTAEKECLDIIYTETMKPGGFLWKLRENEIDWDGAERLLQAIRRLPPVWRERADCDRLAVACLFEVPWEIENTVEHFSERDEAIGRRLSTLAEDLRSAILDLLWSGLEAAYETLT